ncbi:type II toxin-antitoxin system YafQ family toxin [Flagellimonas myxillae]|uniref:type II toxin-antitoxin system YafQ family toxin n=1 Tax=Flagellimonas myxillae TaxID=2942214 RepID=UPI00201E851C|nr:type II toxin-antitoxin system YafQ family toxin [Muricauda myxillae]MCL6267125.1 type II toxin-antitoxin system YafQ family toxin [Muricauda myxillae]
MYQLVPTTQFKKDLKKVKNNEKDFKLTTAVLKALQLKGVKGIPQKIKPHKLSGRYSDNWECHIKPDLLIIWIQIESPKVIKLVRIGSHSDLFK